MNIIKKEVSVSHELPYKERCIQCSSQNVCEVGSPFLLCIDYDHQIDSQRCH